MKRRERIIAGIFALITSLMFWATALRNVAAARSIWVDLVLGRGGAWNSGRWVRRDGS